MAPAWRSDAVPAPAARNRPTFQDLMGGLLIGKSMLEVALLLRGSSGEARKGMGHDLP